MKRILVTGGSGFVGSNFIALYKDKYDICAPTEEEVDLTRFEDVNALFRDNKFDAVVHLAHCNDRKSGAAIEADNLVMFKNVQYAAIRSGVKKLIAVCDAADLDLSRPLVNATENVFGESVPTHGYGAAAYLVTSLAAQDKITTLLRFFAIYGKGADTGTNRIMEILSHAVTGKKEINLAANKTVSAVWVEDACKIIALFAGGDHPRGIYNVASPNPIALYDFAKKARAYAKKDGREVALNLGDGVENELTADTALLAETVGAFKFTAHSTAITKTLDYCKSHKSSLKPKDSVK